MELKIGTKDLVNKILWDESKAVRASGGFTLADVFSEAVKYILKGAFLSIDYGTRLANLVKTGVVVVGSTTTATRVAKNHHFKVGDVIAKSVNGNAVSITSINNTDVNYDVLSHSTNGGAFSEGDVVFEASAVGSGNASYKYKVNALLSDNTKMTSSPTITAVIGALEIQENNLPFPVNEDIKAELGSRFQFI